MSFDVCRCITSGVYSIPLSSPRLLEAAPLGRPGGSGKLSSFCCSSLSLAPLESHAGSATSVIPRSSVEAIRDNDELGEAVAFEVDSDGTVTGLRRHSNVYERLP